MTYPPLNNLFTAIGTFCKDVREDATTVLTRNITTEIVFPDGIPNVTEEQVVYTATKRPEGYKVSVTINNDRVAPTDPEYAPILTVAKAHLNELVSSTC